MTRKPKPRYRFIMKTLVTCAENLDGAREQVEAAYASDGLDRVGAEMILKTIVELGEFYKTFYKPE